MTDLIYEMNHILCQWQNKYDILNCTRLEFEAGPGNTLSLNEIPVSGFCSLPLGSVTFDAEHICFCFTEGRTLHITMFWPEEGVPVVSSVFYP